MPSPVSAHNNEAEISTWYTKFVALALFIVMIGLLAESATKIGEVTNLFLFDRGVKYSRNAEAYK